MTTRLVYSTDGGRTPEERTAHRKSSSNQAPPVPAAPDDGWIRVWRMKAGRGGKTATVVTGVPSSDLERLAVELRRLVGAGGAVRDTAIEVNGDHRERIQKRLTELGFRVKLAGG
jgi:translation initiation factor 1